MHESPTLTPPRVPTFDEEDSRPRDTEPPVPPAVLEALRIVVREELAIIREEIGALAMHFGQSETQLAVKVEGLAADAKSDREKTVDRLSEFHALLKKVAVRVGLPEEQPLDELAAARAARSVGE